MVFKSMFFVSSARMLLCLVLRSFGLSLLIAQPVPLVYYLAQIHSESSGGMMGGPDWTSSSDVYYLTDTFNPLVTTSYRYVSRYWEEAYNSYTDDTYPFSGTIEYFDDYFVICSKHGIPSTNPPYRVSTIDYNGYYLRDDYTMTANSNTPVKSIIYQYDQDMNLICRIFKDNSISKWYKTQCTIDELGRRTEDYTSVSSDSINWIPYCRNEYAYSAEPVTGNPQFDKYAPYVPLFCQAYPLATYPYPYLNDDYKMESVTVTYANAQGLWYSPNTWSLAYQTTTDGYQLGGMTWDYHGLLTESSFYESDGIPSYTFTWAFTDPSGSNDPVSPPQLGLAIYPNPVQREAELHLKLTTPETVRLTTYNLRGQQIKSETFIDRKSGENILQWKATDSKDVPLSNGIYLIKCETQAGTKTIKTIVIN